MGYRRNVWHLYNDTDFDIRDLKVTHVSCSCCSRSVCPGSKKVNVPIEKFATARTAMGQEIYAGGPANWFRKAGCFVNEEQGLRPHCLKHPQIYSNFIFGAQCRDNKGWWPECYLV